MGMSISKSQVSRLCAEIDERVQTFHRSVVIKVREAMSVARLP
jgi:transposase-like protein